MRVTAKLACGLVAFLLLAMTGCQKLKYEKTLEVDVGAVQALIIDGPQREQQVVVEATSDEPVSVYLVLEKDNTVGQDAVMFGSVPDNTLGKEEKKKEIKFEATIPAKSDFVVLVGGAVKKANVKVKVTGK